MKYLVLILLAGCANDSPILKGSGVPADAPAGYVKLCSEYPKSAPCPKEAK